jgi:hypothetical protein
MSQEFYFMANIFCLEMVYIDQIRDILFIFCWSGYKNFGFMYIKKCRKGLYY